MSVPNDLAAFEAMFRRGLGRAVPFLQQQADATLFRDTILNGCFHNLAYDRQCENSRACYVFDVAQATGEPAFYRALVRQTLIRGADDHDKAQLFDLASLFARHGDAAARQTLYAVFARDATAAHDLSGADALIALDGIAGFRFIAAQLLQHPLPPGADLWDEERLLDTLEDALGESNARVALDTLASEDPKLAAFIARLREAKAGKTEYRPRLVPANYEAMRERIFAPGPGLGGPVWRTMERADDELVARLASDLNAETNTERLFKYLHLFRHRAFPLVPDRLLALAQSDDEKLAWRAALALSQVTHPEVRALGLALISQQAPAGARLLISNLAPSDWARLDTALAMVQDEDDLHALGIGVLECAEVSPAPDARPALMTLYEKGFCGMCRNSAVKSLHALGPLPAWMLAECRFDANLDLRELIEEITPDGTQEP